MRASRRRSLLETRVPSGCGDQPGRISVSDWGRDAAGCTPQITPLQVDKPDHRGAIRWSASTEGINPVTGASINIPTAFRTASLTRRATYKAFEFELNKRFSNGWQLLSNFRIGTPQREL